MTAIEQCQTHFDNLIAPYLKTNEVSILGAISSTALSFALTQTKHKNIKNNSILIMPRRNMTHELKNAIEFWDPSLNPIILGGLESKCYSGVLPNRKQTLQRIKWLAHLRQPESQDIFIAAISDLLQYTLPLSVFNQCSKTIQLGDSITPSDISWLYSIGYHEAHRVEDPGDLCVKGGLIDIFSPYHDHPLRLELFGHKIESIRTFDPNNQRSSQKLNTALLSPALETIYTEEERENIPKRFISCIKEKTDETQQIQTQLARGDFFQGVEYLTSIFYKNPQTAFHYIKDTSWIWCCNSIEITKDHESYLSELKVDFDISSRALPPPSKLFLEDTVSVFQSRHSKIVFSAIDDGTSSNTFHYKTSNLNELKRKSKESLKTSLSWILEQKKSEKNCFLSAKTQTQARRLQILLDDNNIKSDIVTGHLWDTWINEQKQHPTLVHIVPRPLQQGVILNSEDLIFITDHELLDLKKSNLGTKKPTSKAQDFIHQFQELKENDLIVHVDHGVAKFLGLTKMNIDGADTELIQLEYKDGDKLYVPIYRASQIQKFTGLATLDKLGSNNWEKTKIKVKNHLRDIANELLQLYAKRKALHRTPFPISDLLYQKFESQFPYEETEDQIKAINDVNGDLESQIPMDRLICGDVGFGKTEVALRAAFKAIQAKKQVAILAPTTVLTFQHLKTFKERFQHTPVNIESLSRFATKKDIRTTLEKIRTGQADIVIGTHRLLSSDVEFSRLGLLIIDEEHRFGVSHKEKIKKMKLNLDCLSLSATPIPRTLNMNLMGIRDLSLMTTPPRDRLPIRTYIATHEKQIIKKAIEMEINRGGQVYYVHNKIKTINSIYEELKSLSPDFRIRIGHGQMTDKDLEKTMLDFFSHEFDVLLCTTIIESGIDIPRANTMIVNDAHLFGLSQLYQLRGRIGRSSERGHCYLIIPQNKMIDTNAQERLRILQENSELGSGFSIAQHDLELRGSGNILGEEQSGNMNAVGYELYAKLLEETLNDLREDQTTIKEIEPEINIRIPALIPDKYIYDIRTRLYFYKKLSNIKSIDEVDAIEDELRDQFGPLPDVVLNLLGLMIVRKICKQLFIQDIRSSKNKISLKLTKDTPLSNEKILSLTSEDSKKYTITPDDRMHIFIKEISWPKIYEELTVLMKL